jgi:hypothetical protein
VREGLHIGILNRLAGDQLVELRDEQGLVFNPCDLVAPFRV